MGRFRMPSLGADMEAGRLVEWLKQPGEAVHRGDIVAVVETEKGAIEIEVFSDGIFEAALVQPGATVPVGTPIALIAGVPEEPEAAEPAPRAERPEPVSPLPLSAALPAEAGRRPLASPAARRLARDRRIDLTRLTGTGPGGAIVTRDLGPAAVRPASHRKGLDLGEMRHAIGAAMARSKREIPHYYLAASIVVARTLGWLEALNAGRPPEQRLLLTVPLVKAVALALRRFPEFNGFWADGRFQPGAGIHVGVAIAIRGGGLVAPAVRDTDQRDVDGLMRHFRDLVARSRIGQLRSSELGDPTVTVTSLGDRGVEDVIGVIYPPQVALVGFGRVVERPWVEGGQLCVRPVVRATLSADHRASDGHRGALFLAEIDRLLQEPETL
jgi:pyruvate dehydrogenase E2 component (dihydrolipoamide acetyltransferase)